MGFGYKVSLLRITPPQRPHDTVSFDEPDLGKGGARGLLERTLREIMADQGQADEDKRTYLRLDDVAESNWGVLLKASGGTFGEPGEVVDRNSGASRLNINSDDAVLRDARLIFILPPVGDCGLMISETRGRSHLGPSVINCLTKRLKENNPSLVLRVEREIADGVAWEAYLDHADVSVSGIELVQRRRAADHSRLTNEDVIRSGTLVLNLERGTKIQRMIRNKINSLFEGNTRLNLAELVGLREYDDEAFDEERIIVVHDGRERRLNVTHGWPSFVYAIYGDIRLSDKDFLDEVHEAARDTLKATAVDLPRRPEWWLNL